MRLRKLAAAGVALAILVGALALHHSAACAGEETSRAGPQAFPTPEALVEAVVEAARANSDDALRAIVGPQYADVVQPGGDPTVARVRAEFVENAGEFWKLDDNEDGSKTLVLGDGRWPFPMPLRSTDAGWVLDVEAGKEEMRMRRIGTNELNAIRLCRAYARAQEEYHAEDRDGDGVREYAQRVRSTEGKRDGLYWSTGEDGEESPFGPLVASIRPYLTGHEKGDPVGGYYWKVILGQGRCAPGGCHHYVINGNMIAGFALLGVPANYGESGVMSFLVSNHGQVYEKDLGRCTQPLGHTMQWFNPDSTWRVVED